MAPPVVRVSSDQLDEMVAVFARALVDEPEQRALFPDERRRAALVPLWGALAVRLSYLNGGVIETTASLSCVSVWTRPGQALSWLSWVRSTPILVRMLSRASPADVRRFVTWATRYEARRHELLPGPHWCLDVLAVLPERQRFGLGAVLARHGLGRADAMGVPTYLETFGEDNAAFYGKLGFEIAEYVVDYSPMDLPTWRMIRQPQTVGPTHSQKRPTATAST